MSHYYDTQGNTVYEVPRADGKGLKETTLREARILKLVPGVTDVLKCAANEGLIKYYEEQLLETCLNYAPPRRIHDQFEYEGWSRDVENWKKVVSGHSKLHAKRASDIGNVIHDAMENGFNNSFSEKTEQFVHPVLDFIKSKFGTEFIPEKSFASSLGFGGKVDLHRPTQELMENDMFGQPAIIIDFKTKPDKAFVEDKLTQYDNHYQQLAAYRLGLDLRGAECYNLFISHETPGLFKLLPEVFDTKEEEKIQRGERMFMHLLHYWQEKNSYDSGFTK